MLLLLLLLLAPDSLSSDANGVPLFVHDLSITVNVDGVDKKVYLAPGVDPETAAQQFCEEHNVSPREPCVHGIVAELSQITQRAFGAARAGCTSAEDAGEAVQDVHRPPAGHTLILSAGASDSQ